MNLMTNQEGSLALVPEDIVILVELAPCTWIVHKPVFDNDNNSCQNCSRQLTTLVVWLNRWLLNVSLSILSHFSNFRGRSPHNFEY